MNRRKWDAILIVAASVLFFPFGQAYAQAPSISSISPTSGPIGSVVILTGSNFGATQVGSTIKLNGTTVMTTSWSSTAIAAIVPVGASSGTFTVSVGGQNANSSTFTVTPLPAGWSDSDIGTVGLAGSSSYANGVFTVKGAGAGIGGSADAMNFVSQPLSGSGSIVARVVSLSGVSTYQQAGVMIRQTLNSGSMAAETIYSSSFGFFQYRATTGGSSSVFSLNATLPYWVEVTWAGSTFNSYISPDGINWAQVGSTETIAMGTSAYVGLGVSSNTTTQLATATFDNVSISSAAAPAPIISSVSATTASVGSVVQINGSNFGPTQGSNLVLLGDLPVTINAWTDTAITITIPAGAASGPLVVVLGPTMNASNPATLTVTGQVLPAGWLDQDIGQQIEAPGSATYANGVFTVKGAGWQIGGTADGTHFVYQTLTGNGSIIARVVSLVGGAGPQAGVMIRETLNSGATMADAVYSSNYLYFQYRATTGGSQSTNSSNYQTLPYWLQVVRNGNTFTAFMSLDGSNWVQSGTSQTISMSGTAYIGLVASSGETTSVATATFDSVSVNSEAAPAPVIAGVSGTTGAVGSQVEITGYNFGNSQGNSLATLNGSALTVNSWSATEIVVTIPSGATSGSLLVSVAPTMNDSNPVGFTVTSQPLPIGIFDEDGGPVGLAGSATYSGGIYTVKGAGGGIYGTADSMHFVFTPLSGNGSIIARVLSLSAPTGAQAGVMIRETLAPGATMAYTEFRAGYLYFDYRTTTNGSAAASNLNVLALPQWMQVVRNGNSFSSYMSLDGVNWVQVGSTETITMATNVFIGLAVSSESTTTLATATFDNLSISSSVAPAPIITGLSATTGAIGNQITISGTGFGASQGISQVLINDLATTIKSWTATAITITIPSGATSGPLVVAVAPSLNASNPVVFTITSQPLPSGWLDQDVGQVPVQGSASYASGVFTVNATGQGVTSNADSFHFVYSPLAGNGTIIARVASVTGTSYGLAGVMIRETMNPGATVALSNCNAVNYCYFWYRSTTGGTQVGAYSSGISLPNWVQVVRNGSTFSGYESSDGVNWVQVGSTQTINMAQNVYIGLAVASASSTSSTLATAALDHVSVSTNSSPPTPSISSFSPTSAPTGAWVTINGTSFEPTLGNSTVTFNGVAGTLNASSNWSPTSFRVPVPTGVPAGSRSVIVTVGGVASTPASFTIVPGVTSVSPVQGVVATSVTITGTSFGATKGSSSTLKFNGVAATAITSWTDTQIVATVPSAATTGPVTVTVNSAQSSTGILYTVIHPIISSLSPAFGPFSGTITVNGSGFGSSEGNGQVYFNGARAGIYTWTNTAVSVAVPAAATTGPVTVTSSGLTSNGVQFTLEGTLAVTGISPTAGPIGSSVTITGTGFGSSQGLSTVTLNSIPLTVTTWNDTQIVAIVPTGTATGAITVNEESLSATGPTFAINSTVQVTDSLGHQTSYTADLYGGKWYIGQSQGSGCSSCDIRGNISNTFSITGNILSTTDELGLVTSYTYDSSNDVTSVTQPTVSAGTPTTTYTYNSFGEVLVATDPLGHVTTNTYDAHGNLLSVATPAPGSGTAASVTQFTYNSLGEMTQIQDPLNRIRTIAYNAAGLIASITDAQGHVTSYGYDSRGNRMSVTDAMNNQTTFAYDSGSRLTTITYPGNATTVFAYDYRGRRISVTDQNSKKTTYAYDAADRLTSVTDPNNNVTQYTYDTENNLLSIEDANNHTTSFTYDAFGRVNTTTFPSTHSETYTYDADSNLTGKTDRNGNAIQYVYDALNRLSQKSYPNSTSVEYTYDLVGKVLSVNDPTGTYGFAYDNMGRLIGATTQYSFLSSTNFTNSYSYDADSNRVSMTDPQSGVTSYAYDTLNRLSTLTPPAAFGSGSFGFTYDALSRRTQMSRPNGVTTNYTYNNLSQLLSVLHQVGTSTIDGAVYTVDPAGNRTTKTDKYANVTSNYTYDPLYELTQVTQSTTTTETYSFDPVGNRLSSLGVSSYSVNASNELTSIPGTAYTFDNNGNTLTKVTSAGTTTYGWDYENKLTSVTLPATGGSLTLKYDPFGRRIQKSFTTGSTTTNYLYDGDNDIEEVNASGSVVARYTHGQNIDEPLAESRSSTTSFYEADGLGSVTSLSSSGGSLANTYTYDSFGELTASTGSITNPFRYTSREFDSETGLYYYRARYYDPNTGRFLSEDPIQFRGGINFYAYVRNNATNRTDADGMAFKDCPTALGELELALWDVELRTAQLLPNADAGHVKRLQQAVDTLEWAIGQVEKYCKCSKAEIAALLAAAATAIAAAARSLAQFCVAVPVCEFAKNDGLPSSEDQRLAMSSTANTSGEQVYAKAFGRAGAGMNWAVEGSHWSCNIDEASLVTEGGKVLFGGEAPLSTAAG